LWTGKHGSVSKWRRTTFPLTGPTTSRNQQDSDESHEKVTALGARVPKPAAHTDDPENFYAHPAGRPFCLCSFTGNWSLEQRGSLHPA
jgi:hypothetical protein